MIVIENKSPVFRIAFIIVLIFIFFCPYLKASSKNILNLSKQKTLYLNDWLVTGDITGKEVLSFPDSIWMKIDNLYGAKNNSTGLWLLKTEVIIEDSYNHKDIYALFPKNYISAYEIYWDGKKIGENGKVGKNLNDEIPGKFDYELILNDSLLTKGTHTIIYRVSNFVDASEWKWFNGWTAIAPYNLQLKAFYQNRFISFLIAGIIFIPLLFNLFLYITRKFKTEHLFFALICLLVISDHLTGQVPLFFEASTRYINTEYNLYSFLVLSNSFLIPAFFVFLFSLPKKIIFPVLFIFHIGIYNYVDIWNMYKIFTPALLIESMIISGWALYKKKDGSLIIFIGVIFSWIAFIYNLPFASLNTILVICTSLSIAIEFAKKEKGEREAQLRSSRLENELLKKNINSHFLMNTLTSIIVWLRRDPESATKLIEALANEFRMVMHISGLKQIPVRQEIELCRTHLEIMNYRKGAEYKLMTEGINEEELIPPMIFHTLIENGLTHGFENKNCGTFNLTSDNTKDGIRYVVTNDGDFKNCEKKNSTGFGLQYVKTRLEESFPGKWNLESCKIDDSWKVIIEIKK